MHGRVIGIAAVLVALLAPAAAVDARAEASAVRTGWMGIGRGTTLDAFRQGMRALPRAGDSTE